MCNRKRPLSMRDAGQSPLAGKLLFLTYLCACDLGLGQGHFVPGREQSLLFLINHIFEIGTAGCWPPVRNAVPCREAALAAAPAWSSWTALRVLFAVAKAVIAAMFCSDAWVATFIRSATPERASLYSLNALTTPPITGRLSPMVRIFCPNVSVESPRVFATPAAN